MNNYGRLGWKLSWHLSPALDRLFTTLQAWSTRVCCEMAPGVLKPSLPLLCIQLLPHPMRPEAPFVWQLLLCSYPGKQLLDESRSSFPRFTVIEVTG